MDSAAGCVLMNSNKLATRFCAEPADSPMRSNARPRPCKALTDAPLRWAAKNIWSSDSATWVAAAPARCAMSCRLVPSFDTPSAVVASEDLKSAVLFWSWENPSLTKYSFSTSALAMVAYPFWMMGYRVINRGEYRYSMAGVVRSNAKFTRRRAISKAAQTPNLAAGGLYRMRHKRHISPPAGDIESVTDCGGYNQTARPDALTPGRTVSAARRTRRHRAGSRTRCLEPAGCGGFE